jgi:hypothetical protein
MSPTPTRFLLEYRNLVKKSLDLITKVGSEPWRVEIQGSGVLLQWDKVWVKVAPDTCYWKTEAIDDPWTQIEGIPPWAWDLLPKRNERVGPGDQEDRWLE